MPALNALSSLQRQHGYNQQASLGTWAGNKQHLDLLPGYKKPAPVQPVRQPIARQAPRQQLLQKPGRQVSPLQNSVMRPTIGALRGDTRPLQERQQYPMQPPIGALRGDTRPLQERTNQAMTYPPQYGQQDYYNLLQALFAGGNMYQGNYGSGRVY